MAVKVNGKYLGKLKVELTHEPSSQKIQTAAPVDNAGDGSSFSPTDLVASALGSCVITIMAIVAERHNIPFEGTTFELEKHMNPDPRRIGSIPIKIQMPSGLSPENKKKLENAAHTCPVARSLLPEIKKEITFVYPE